MTNSLFKLRKYNLSLIKIKMIASTYGRLKRINIDIQSIAIVNDWFH